MTLVRASLQLFVWAMGMQAEKTLLVMVSHYMYVAIDMCADLTRDTICVQPVLQKHVGMKLLERLVRH